MASTTLAGIALPELPALPSAALVRYKILQLFSMPTTGKLLAVLAVALHLVLAGGYAYKAAMGCTWGEAFTKAYHAISNIPGSNIAKERSRAAMLITNSVYLAGILGFALVLGIISTDVSTAIKEVRSGNFPVVEKHHTVVLGWNKQTLPTLRQMAIAQSKAAPAKPFGLPIVVLADRDKAEMDKEISDALGNRLPVITRTGYPSRLDDLRRTAAADASTVLLQYPDSLPRNEASAEQAAALAALKRESGRQKVVVQGDGEAAEGLDAAAVAMAAVRGWAGADSAPGVSAETVVTSGPRRIGQVMAQVALQPGLEYVLSDLLEFEEGYEGTELYMTTVSDTLAGSRYRDVRRSFTVGVVVGFVEPGGNLKLNPRDNDTVPRGSQLVFVTSKQYVQQEAGPVEPKMPRLRRGRSGAPGKKHVAVLCFGPDSANLLGALKDFCPKGSRVTFISSDPAAKDAIRALQRKGIRATAVVGDPSCGAVLQGAGLEKADAAVLTGLMADPTKGDAQVVASVLQLQALAAQHQAEGKRATSLDVVASVRANSTEEVLWHATISHSVERACAEAEAAAAASKAKRGRAVAPREFPPAVELHMLNPDQLMSGMVTQAAIEPRLNRVFGELLTSDAGHEIYLRPASCFGLPPAGRGPRALSWAQICEAVRAKGQTAIGIAPSEGGPGALRLAPASRDVFEITASDEIVVIAAQ